ncbi:MAG: hypothetical protein AAFX87_14420 [Bacteroidota bacterium]
MTKASFSLIFILITQVLRAQPGTDIYLFDLKAVSGQIEISNPKNVTQRTGYDNQPYFYSKGKRLFYTALIDGSQTEIFSYDLSKNQSVKMTNTEESEYSPTITPDKRSFSTIRVEKDGTQRLWQFPIKGGEPSLVFNDVKPVGYHCWVDKERIVMFVLGEPNTMQVGLTSSQQSSKIAESVGRSFHHIPNSELISFIHKETDEQWFIKSYNPETGAIKTIVKTLPKSEDIAWLKDGTVLMGSENVLYKFHPKQDKSWVKVVDLNEFNLPNGFTRLAVDSGNKKLAIVVNE